MSENEIFNSEPNANQLTRHVNSGEMVVFVGSGFSQGLYPSWHELVLNLCQGCGVTPEVKLHKDTEVEILVDLAEKSEKANPQQFAKIIEDAFSKPLHDQKIAYQRLMSINFKSYVTINFDPLLAFEKVTRPEYKKRKLRFYPDIKTTYLSNQNLLYIHGGLGPDRKYKRDTIVLTKSSFCNAYSIMGNDLGTFWDVLLTEHCVLFIACGLREPEIQIALKRCKERRDRMEKLGLKPPPLFMLREAYILEDGALGSQRTRDIKREQQEQTDFTSLGIRIVRYDPKDKIHTGLLQILDGWNTISAKINYGPENEAWY